MTQKTKLQMGFLSAYADGDNLQTESGATLTMGEIRSWIKGNNIQPGDLFPTSKDDDSKNDMIPDSDLIPDANKKGDDGDSLIPD